MLYFACRIKQQRLLLERGLPMVSDSTQSAEQQQKHFTSWKGTDQEFIPIGMTLVSCGSCFNLFSFVSISYQPDHVHNSC